MVGQITYPSAQLTSTTASPSLQNNSPVAAEKDAADAKTAIAQLRARLQTVSSENPAAASRIAGEIDSAAKEYRAAGGVGPIPGVPAEVSRLRHQSAEDGSDISQRQQTNGSVLDIRV